MPLYSIHAKDSGIFTLYAVEDVSNGRLNLLQRRCEQAFHGVKGQSKHSLRRPSNRFIAKLVYC